MLKSYIRVYYAWVFWFWVLTKTYTKYYYVNKEYMIQILTSFLCLITFQEVIGLGATNIVVPGNFPIGCVPLYLVLFATNDTSKYDELNCLKEYNDFSKFYNQQLLQAIQQLQQEHPDVAIVYADYYAALTSVISNPLKLGNVNLYNLN